MFLIFFLFVRYVCLRARVARTRHTTIVEAAPCRATDGFTDKELAWFRAPIREGR